VPIVEGAVEGFPQPLQQKRVTYMSLLSFLRNRKSCFFKSEMVRNLFFSGEVPDMEANTGGNNLQAAWTSGFIA